MLSANNVLSPAHGRPLVTPTQDMIIGAHYLTEIIEDGTGAGRAFRNIDEVRAAYERGHISLHAPIQYRGHEDLMVAPANGKAAEWELTTAGRVFFNHTLPDAYPYVNSRIGKREMGVIVDDLARGYVKSEVAQSLDAIKDMCFEYAARSGLTVSIDDVKTPKEKTEILDRHEKQADKIEQQFRRGIITDGERRQMEVEVWSEATEEVTDKMKVGLEADDFQPGEHDGRLGSPREHDAGPPDRGHARPGGQPPRRHDPPPDQEQLPRGPEDARVLHRDSWRPEGSGPTPLCGRPTRVI